jgi:hypothetical protein
MIAYYETPIPGIGAFSNLVTDQTGYLARFAPADACVEDHAFRKIHSVSHPLALAVFPTVSSATEAARTIHALGISREHISVVAHDHAEARTLADQMDATPGVELEDSRLAALLGELGGLVLAAIAVVMPGIGPIVAAGPLAAELGEAAGHAAGSLASVLKAAGLPPERAEALQHGVARGGVLLGVHVPARLELDRVRDGLSKAGATQLEIVTWTT